MHASCDFAGEPDAIRRAAEGIVIKESVHPLPFSDGEFDAVTMFEVLELIAHQDRTLRDVYRVLKPGGLLLVSVPRRHIFSFLDLGNFKVMFPNAHRIYYTLIHSEQAWRERYEANPHGLVGGRIEREKAWHQHFRDNEMRDLLERNDFHVVAMDGSGLFNQPMTFIGYVFRLHFLFPQRVWDWNNRAFHTSSLLSAACKPAAGVTA